MRSRWTLRAKSNAGKVTSRTPRSSLHPLRTGSKHCPTQPEWQTLSHWHPPARRRPGPVGGQGVSSRARRITARVRRMTVTGRAKLISKTLPVSDSRRVGRTRTRMDSYHSRARSWHLRDQFTLGWACMHPVTESK